MSNRLLFSGLIISAGIILGRLSGFLRELIVANNFGASENSDLIIIFLTTPDFLVSLLMGGAMTMVLIPEFRSLNEVNARILFKQLTKALFVSGVVLCLILFPFIEELLHSLAIGMSSELISNNNTHFFYSLLAIPFSLAAGVSFAYLHSLKKFITPSLSTLVINIIIIIFLFVASISPNEYLFLIIAIGIISASIFRWGIQLLSLKMYPYQLARSQRNLISLELVKRYVYAISTGCIALFIPVIVRTISSSFGEGKLSLVNYSIKLVELPLGAIITVLSLLFIPILTDRYLKKEVKNFEICSKIAFSVSICLSCFILLPLYIFSDFFSELVYGWGSLTEDQLTEMGGYLSILCISLPFQGGVNILITIFSARKDTKTPFLCASVLGIALFYVLIAFSLDIKEVLISLVTYYLVLFAFLSTLLKVKHKINLIFNVNALFFFLIGAVTVYLLSKFQLSQTLFQTNEMIYLFLTFYVAIGLILFFKMYKRFANEL